MLEYTLTFISHCTSNNFHMKEYYTTYCKLLCSVISLLVFVLRRKTLRVIVFHVSENSTNPIACSDFHHENLTPNSVIMYRGSCPVLYKLSTIIKKCTTATTHCALRSPLSNLSAVLLLHCDNNNNKVVLNSSAQNLRISPDTEPHTDTTAC